MAEAATNHRVSAPQDHFGQPGSCILCRAMAGRIEPDLVHGKSSRCTAWGKNWSWVLRLVRDSWRLWSAVVPAVVGRAELVAQPPERGPGRLVGHLGVDLHRERDTAVPEDRHRDPRVNVERGEQ